MLIGRMRQLRYLHSYSQEYVMENTGLDIPNLETGRNTPNLYSITVLCKFYGITLREFFENFDYPEPPER